MADIQKWEATEPFISVSGSLLEGPYYDEAKNELRFVDILEEKLHIVDLEKGPSSLRTLNTGTPIGITANIETTETSQANAGKIIAGAKYGFATIDEQTGAVEYIKKIWTEADGEGKEERMRFNDGSVDSRGRFWAGMMTDLKHHELKFEGAMFRLDADLSLHRVIEDMGIPNGMNWNKEDNLLYVTDSPTKQIFLFDYDAESGAISNRRVFFTFEGEQAPDGFAMDEEGHLWVAMWGGSKVIRVSPEAKIVGEISMPTKCITCTEFSGTDLFITTAKDDSSPEDTFGGHLYKVNVGVRGKPRNKVQLRA
ncbi:hypothetical protein AJ80_07798 [Polytolypa hystricis UAMH7299]|uniref:SMP-30/Gluconolactonase/LRE-like region domain-containing protein n=1 Tax=Polytolypa hystricis (strain UAMH7299) TaxID=1447883 RepID=A0A2B7XIK5_POLH7|nr:hypothetical protein AJ80_07798 [Polytolypa hystricis UAMH7299]